MTGTRAGTVSTTAKLADARYLLVMTDFSLRSYAYALSMQRLAVRVTVIRNPSSVFLHVVTSRWNAQPPTFDLTPVPQGTARVCLLVIVNRFPFGAGNAITHQLHRSAVEDVPDRCRINTAARAVCSLPPSSSGERTSTGSLFHCHAG